VGWTAQCKEVTLAPSIFDDEETSVIMDGEEEEEMGQPLLTGANFVRDVQGQNPVHMDCQVVECELWRGQARSPLDGRVGGYREAWASPPGMLEVYVPEDHKQGERVLMHGPHGKFIARLPAEAQPGTTFRYPLKPMPEFRMEVPPGRRPGDTVKFQRSDGEEIEIDVPEGLAPGDTFDVSPPALIIQVPEEARPGEHVLFLAEGGASMPEVGWYRAKVPDRLKLGRYFAAKLPGPITVNDTKLQL